MEDRATKRIMRDGSLKKVKDERDMYGNYSGPPKPFKPVGKRQKATEDELTTNPRARSAALRVAERQQT
jgi:16S rRNA (cytosine1402-N4)-methyltransferase